MLPGLYATPSLPLAWIVIDDDGAAWIVPAIRGGWAARKSYRGPTRGLQSVAFGIALGVLISVGLPVDLIIITPAEAAALTGGTIAESTWRNKAAAGAIPGAIKKGKQWLIPRAAVDMTGADE